MNLDPIQSLEGVNVLETFLHEGFKCAVVRRTYGSQDHHCGYVLVEKDSPLYDLDYGTVPISVHGGITYSSRESDGWLYGFDCCHSDDGRREGDAGWKDATYVRAETVSMAEQFVILSLTASEPWAMLAKTFEIDPFSVSRKVKVALMVMVEVLAKMTDE